jgi:hypothetical protein
MSALGVVGASAYYLTHVNQTKIVPEAHKELTEWEE